MFGIDDVLLFPLIGGAMGAVTNRKDPLTGALIGGGLGLVGNAIPGMIPTQAAAPIVEAGKPLAWTTATDGLTAQEAGLGMAEMDGWKGAAGGRPGGLLNPANGKPGLLGTVGNAANTAATIKALMPADQPMPNAPQFHTGGAGGVGDFYTGIRNQRMSQAKADLEKQVERYQLINRMR